VTLLGIVNAPNLPAGHSMRVVWLLSINTPAKLEYAPFWGSTLKLLSPIQP
jgi:hypothetical protein